MVIDTEVTPELRAEGDARELQRAIQDLRKDAGLDLDAKIELWLDGVPPEVEPYLAGVARETLAQTITRGPATGGDQAVTVELSGAAATISLRALRDGRGSE